jgi:hypothetical protein
MTIELPELPPTKVLPKVYAGPATPEQYNREAAHEAATRPAYTADQMRSYAMEAVRVERKRLFVEIGTLAGNADAGEFHGIVRAQDLLAAAIRQSTKG